MNPNLDHLPPHEHFTRLQRRQGVMDPAHKILLDEISKRVFDELSKRFEENDTSWIKRLSDRDVIWEK